MVLIDSQTHPVPFNPSHILSPLLYPLRQTSTGFPEEGLRLQVQTFSVIVYLPETGIKPIHEGEGAYLKTAL